MPRNIALAGKCQLLPFFTFRSFRAVTSFFSASSTSSTIVSVRNLIFSFFWARSSMIFEARKSARR